MKKILVLDDEIDVEFIFKTMLEDEIADHKLQIDFFSNPQTCLDQFSLKNKPSYDYILSDINMPAISGIKFAEEVRNQGYTGPIAFISAYLVDDYEKDMTRLKVNEFISKPINFDSIKQLLEL